MAATPAKLNTPFKSGKIKGMTGGKDGDDKVSSKSPDKSKGGKY
jgi:hypothetical protein